MWEYRLIWTVGAPSWWDETWRAAEATLHRHGREPEGRPDTYFVLEDRSDIGLKLRGGAEEDVDAKVRHRREYGWELWEKIAFFEWNDLEAVRFAALLQRDVPTETATDNYFIGFSTLMSRSDGRWIDNAQTACGSRLSALGAIGLSLVG